MPYQLDITFFKVAIIAYLFAMVFYLAYLVFKSQAVGKIASGITYFGLLAHTTSIGVRWWETYQMGSGMGHVPISNLFESMSFGAWTIILIYAIVEWRYKNRTFGAFVMPVAILAMTYIFVAPNISKSVEPLVPALKSYWLYIHVITSFLGYAAFAVSFGVSLMYLIITTDKKDPAYVFWTACVGLLITVIIAIGIDSVVLPISGGQHMLEGTFRSDVPVVRLLSYLGTAVILFMCWLLGAGIRKRILGFANTSDMLDEVGYKTIMMGFPLLTVGIITGAVWANKAWGTYWGWDPKETWSFITWLVYAAYLHARLTRGWKGKRAAVLSMVGFLAVIFTYLGVNLLLSGLHSYGSAS